MLNPEVLLKKACQLDSSITLDLSSLAKSPIRTLRACPIPRLRKPTHDATKAEKQTRSLFSNADENIGDYSYIRLEKSETPLLSLSTFRCFLSHDGRWPTLLPLSLKAKENKKMSETEFKLTGFYLPLPISSYFLPWMV